MRQCLCVWECEYLCLAVKVCVWLSRGCCLACETINTHWAVSLWIHSECLKMTFHTRAPQAAEAWIYVEFVTICGFGIVHRLCLESIYFSHCRSSFSSAQWERGLHDDKAESSDKQKQIRVSLPLSQTIAFYKWTLWAPSFFRQREGNCCFMGALQHEALQEIEKPLIVSREANVFSVLFAAVCLSSVFFQGRVWRSHVGRRLCRGPAVVSPT